MLKFDTIFPHLSKKPVKSNHQGTREEKPKKEMKQIDLQKPINKNDDNKKPLILNNPDVIPLMLTTEMAIQSKDLIQKTEGLNSIETLK